MRPRVFLATVRLLVLCVCSAVTVVPARGATITVVNLDGAGEGFNDPTPTSPVGGNAGTTLGEQRLVAFQYAADVWGALIESGVEIRVGANFDELFCSPISATLGAAGPTTVHRDFVGAPVPSTWYPQALANALAGADLSSSDDDVSAVFNSGLDGTPPCFTSWYYGLDANPPGGDIDFMTVVLHELGHGLGFLSLVDDATGQKFLGFDDAYMLHLEDHSTGLLYPEMTDAERAAAATDTGDLHWVGPAVVGGSGGLAAGVDPSGHVEIYAPNPVAPGSSVSHFSTSLSPSEMMEPFYAGLNHNPGLALDLFADLGWFCGNGGLDFVEGCDDGNTLNGDCCSSMCEPETPGTPCDDGSVCTASDVCDGAGSCGGTCQTGLACGMMCGAEMTCGESVPGVCVCGG